MRNVIKKENFLPVVLSAIITALFYVDTHYLNHELLVGLWILIAVVFTLLVFAVFLYAGFIVMKSLFYLSAELSLLIFLAQEYCDTQIRSGDAALGWLVMLAILYISYKFLESLNDALKKRIEQIPEKEWSKEKIFIVGLFLFFSVLLVYMIYQVVSPIIGELCVYQPK